MLQVVFGTFPSPHTAKVCIFIYKPKAWGRLLRSGFFFLKWDKNITTSLIIAKIFMTWLLKITRTLCNMYLHRAHSHDTWTQWWNHDLWYRNHIFGSGINSNVHQSSKKGYCAQLFRFLIFLIVTSISEWMITLYLCSFDKYSIFCASPSVSYYYIFICHIISVF